MPQDLSSFTVEAKSVQRFYAKCLFCPTYFSIGRETQMEAFNDLTEHITVHGENNA